MNPIQIDSIDDERVAVYRDLPGRRLTRESGLFIAEGRLLVERLVASSYGVHSILVDERRVSQLPACSPEVPVLVAHAGLVEQIVGFNFHRGMLAAGCRRASPSVDDLGETALILCCVDVQDPTNLGGILRNCAAFGVDAVVVSGSSADPFSRRVVRVSMGAVLKLTIIESNDIRQDLVELRERRDVELVASVVADGERLESARRASRTALIVGNEAHGLPDDVVDLTNRRVTIPMQLQTDSLNAAVASGVLLYHFSRVAAGPTEPAS